jgi:stage II sporulation SpoE-like protein/GAF domain-containing protein
VGSCDSSPGDRKDEVTEVPSPAGPRGRPAPAAVGTDPGGHDDLEERLRRSYDRSQTLLAASQSFSDTVTVDDVRHRLGELMSTELGPSYVGLSLLGDNGRMERVRDARFPPGIEDTGPWRSYGLNAAMPTARAVREGRIIAYGDRAGFDADHPEPVRRILRDLGLHALVVVPLPHVRGPVGSLVLGWDEPRRLEPPELLTVTTLAGYAAQALDRARRLHHRDSVAHQLQQAMLTTLPDVAGLTMSARYQPADTREDVGGDWYDAAPVPDPAAPDGRCLAISVGDVVGHNLAAATVMGQVRSMLRQAAWDHPGGPPSVTLGALERAAAGLGLEAVGTALLAHLCRMVDGTWSMTWTNAGHPPPVLLSPDGGATLLDGHDVMFGFPSLLSQPRHDRRRDVAAGSTLFLYTDGLVERRGSDLDEGTDRLVRLLGDNRALPPHELVDLAVDGLAPESPDDVIAFAVRFDEPRGARPAIG